MNWYKLGMHQNFHKAVIITYWQNKEKPKPLEKKNKETPTPRLNGKQTNKTLVSDNS